MYLRAQWGKKRARFLVLLNFCVSEMFLTYMSIRSSTSIRASETSRPVISWSLNLFARCLAWVPSFRCMLFSLAMFASSLKKDIWIFLRGRS